MIYILDTGKAHFNSIPLKGGTMTTPPPPLTFSLALPHFNFKVYVEKH